MNSKKIIKNTTSIIADINDSIHESYKIDLELVSAGLWEEYKKLLADDHRSLYKILNCYISQREQGFKVVPLAIKLPCYLSRVFGVEDRKIIRTATLGTCFLDHYTQILDDVTDLKVPFDPEMVHASHEMLLEGMTILMKYSVGYDGIGNKIKKYIMEAMDSERQLWPNRISIGLYGDSEYTALSKRGGVIRSAAAVYASASGRLDILSIIENCLLNISQAIQLLDDISDWQEDFMQKRVTSIINSGYINIGKHENDNIIFDALLERRAFQGNIRRVLHLLNEAESRFYIYKPAELIRTVESIKESAQYAEELFSHLDEVPKGERMFFIKKQLESVVATNMMH